MELTPTCSVTAESSSSRSTGSPPLMSAASTNNFVGASAANHSGISKPKQSKSRNGCATCKSKRLKCDETKPTCRQCEKRNVTCGGYQRDFKWRSFGKNSFAGKLPSKGKKVTAAAAAPAGGLSASSKEATASVDSHVSEGSTVSTEDDVSQRSTVPPQPPATLDVSDKEDSITWIFSPRDLGSSCGEDGDTVAGSLDTSLEESSIPTDDLFSDSQTIYTPTIALDDMSPLMPFALPFMEAGDDTEEGMRCPPCGPEDIQWDSLPLSSTTDSKNKTLDAAIQHGPIYSTGSPEMLLMRFDQRTCGILSIKDGITENPWRTLIWPLAADNPALYHAICSLAAFHSSKEEPQLRVYGMDHMRRSIKTLARDIREMRTDAALATTLALAFAESWDRHISSGIQHLRGAKALVAQAISFQQRNGLKRSDLARLRFLYNTWTYTSVIARLTSVEDVGVDELCLSPIAGPPTQIHEIDPLMGCATTLFPLIGRVASLVQKVRTTATNSIALISQAIELKTLVEQWEPPKYFEPPEDPTSDVQHSFQTAQAYRWATLLHLHQAVPEIPSESSADMAKRVLVLLATVPPSSRTTVVHIYPLLAASCEVETEEDRNWVRERWRAMQSRLKIGNIDRCLEVIHEVWARRDQHVLRSLEDGRLPFVVPVDTMRRRYTMDVNDIGMCMGNQEHSEETYDFPDRPSRRFSANDIDGMALSLSPPPSPSMPIPMSTTRRASPDSGFENVGYEKTVRGRLHWAGVMRDWNWEVLLG